ncbi:hypothetical protein EYC84_000397 [Monilinia fructicola]|uniref:Mannan polymerase II complex ANP1 subunit n=1 Tax=Monilinia fructicola TaxID=38448 RepID=A0A5M9JQW5_MONFR|nr:hypothetical protein EYC84_000397 [Monilinia fructicola]
MDILVRAIRYSKNDTYSISPHRFQPRTSPPALRRRRQLLVRLTLVLAFALLVGTLSTRNCSILRPLECARDCQRLGKRRENLTLRPPSRCRIHLPMFFGHLRNFTYPHHLIDLAFLVSDSKDNTLPLLSELLEKLQADEDPKQPFGEISIIEKDFGQKVNQDVESRHGFAAQASRRKLMAQARNWLLSAALRPYHSWVYWRDVDVETAPFTILEDLMRHNKDVITFGDHCQIGLEESKPYDLNSWQESETALALADTLDEDAHAETEGFGKMAKRMKFSVVGLPHYTIWHLKWNETVSHVRRKKRRKAERMKKVKDQFDDPSSQWEKDKNVIANEAFEGEGEEGEGEGEC